MLEGGVCVYHQYTTCYDYLVAGVRFKLCKQCSVSVYVWFRVHPTGINCLKNDLPLGYNNYYMYTCIFRYIIGIYYFWGVTVYVYIHTNNNVHADNPVHHKSRLYTVCINNIYAQWKIDLQTSLPKVAIESLSKSPLSTYQSFYNAEI